eukprot:GILJ01001278.1.p1 GENE.GILJ01001278.1~~GILJ01001278.1.p1  ORF type:complete len:403 (+),score=41.84 GILJ01001278.1:39-1247(+)
MKRARTFEDSLGAPPVRIVIPGDHVGYLIGKGGATMRGVTSETGAGVHVDEVPLENGSKVLTINGPPDRREAALERILNMLRKVFKITDDSLPCSVVAFIPGEFAALVIGARGRMVQDINRQSGADVQVAPQRTGQTDRPVTVTGTCRQIVHAVHLIHEVIETHLVKRQRAAGSRDQRDRPVDREHDGRDREPDSRDREYDTRDREYDRERGDRGDRERERGPRKDIERKRDWDIPPPPPRETGNHLEERDRERHRDGPARQTDRFDSKQPQPASAVESKAVHDDHPSLAPVSGTPTAATTPTATALGSAAGSAYIHINLLFPQAFVEYLVADHGEQIQAISQRTGCSIAIAPQPETQHNAAGMSERRITLVGSTLSNQNAFVLLQDAMIAYIHQPMLMFSR